MKQNNRSMISGRLQKKIEENKITQKELCDFIGMTTHGLRKALLNDDFKISTLQKISEFFKVPISYWFREEGDNIFLHNQGNIMTGNSVKGASNVSLSLQDKCEDLERENERLVSDIEMLRELLKAKEELIVELRKKS